MHERVAGRVTMAAHKARALCAVDKTHDAVVAQHEGLRELADRRSVLGTAASYCEQKLMLGWGEAVRIGLFLAPVQEAAQAGAQVQELPVLLVCQVIDNMGIVS